MDRCEQCEEKKRLLTEEHKKRRERRERELERIRAAEKAGESYDTFLLFLQRYKDMRLPWKTKIPSAPINIFDFNHINPALPKETVEILKKVYAFYHKKHWGYSKLYREFQRKNLACNVVAGKAIISSAVAGGITLNPIVFATLTGFGLVVKGVARFKKYDKKAEKTNFARIE